MSDGSLIPLEPRTVKPSDHPCWDYTWATASGTQMESVIYQSWLHLRTETDDEHTVTVYTGSGLFPPSSHKISRATVVIPIVHDGFISVISEDGTPIKAYYQERRGIAPGN